jgi:hypothetical protein
LLSLVATTIGLAACGLVLGIDERPLFPDATQAHDAGKNADGDGDAAAEATCNPDSIAEAPAAPPGQPGPRDARYYAFTLLDLGIDGGAEGPGFDLDHQVNRTLETNSCTVSANANLTVVKDSVAGVDNAAFQLLQGLLGTVLNPANINGRLVAGEFGMVVRLADWNGTNDDDQVTVFFFPALAKSSDGRWVLDQRFRGIFDVVSTLSAREAWVRGGKLVAGFDKLTIPIRFSNDDTKPFDIVLREAWITADLSSGGASLDNGTLGGRAKSSDFLGQVRSVYVAGRGYLCVPANRSIFDGALSAVCGTREIRSSHCDDGRSVPCDAMSFGARFAAETVGPQTTFDGGVDLYKDRCLDVGDVEAGVDCP